MPTIEQAIYDLYALDRCDAEQLSQEIIDRTIDVLLHDPALPPRSFLIWSIKLANARQQIAEHLHPIVDNRIDRDDVLRELDLFGLRDIED
jgi:hypothetical protein